MVPVFVFPDIGNHERTGKETEFWVETGVVLGMLLLQLMVRIFVYYATVTYKNHWKVAPQRNRQPFTGFRRLFMKKNSDNDAPLGIQFL